MPPARQQRAGRHEAAEGQGVALIICEPMLSDPEFFGSPVITDLVDFKRRADVIVANRQASELADVADKVYTRDLSGRD